MADAMRWLRACGVGRGLRKAGVAALAAVALATGAPADSAPRPVAPHVVSAAAQDGPLTLQVVGRLGGGGSQTLAVVDDSTVLLGLGAGIVSLDVSNPAWPVMVGRLDGDGMPSAIAVAGGLAYVGTATGLQAADAGDPRHMRGRSACSHDVAL